MHGRTWVLVGLAVGCAATTNPRFLRIVDGDAGAQAVEEDTASGPTRWVPPSDSGAPDAVSTICGGEAGAIDWSAGGHGYPAASVDWCRRISPDEPTTTAPTCTNGDSGLADDGGAPPPCGFFNLIGSLSGHAPEAPLLFCDHDPTGGLRIAWVSEEGVAEERLVAEGDCVADPDSGALVRTEDGWLAVWLTAGTGEDGNVDPGARYVRVGTDDQTEISPPARTGLAGLGSQLHYLPGDPSLAWVRDPAGSVLLTRLAPEDLSLAGPAVPFAFDIASLSVARTSDGGSLAALCSRGGELSLRRVLGDGSPEPPLSLSHGCDATARLHLAVQPDGSSALGLDNGDRGSVLLLSSDGAETSAVDLGEGAHHVRVAARPDGWLVLDSTGLLRHLSLDGTARGTLVLPQLAQAEGSIEGLRFADSGDTARVVALGQQSVDLGFGHVNTYNTVEISRVRLESL